MSAEIEARIPHRDPFLLIDAIEDEGEGWIETTWTVPVDADWVRGHYPDLIRYCALARISLIGSKSACIARMAWSMLCSFQG